MSESKVLIAEKVDHSELIWAGLWALGVVTFSTLPYLLAWLLTPSGYLFTGVLANPMDAFSYLAKMRESAQGAWLLHLPYMSEPHNTALVYPQYVALGKIAAVTGVPIVFVYHAARVLSGLLLLAVGHRFLTTLIADTTVRKTAFLLFATSSGFTWITGFFGYLATDVTIPESNTFHTIFANVHFSLATAIFLGVMCLAFENWARFTWRPMMVGGLLNAILTLMQPFLLVTQAAVLGIGRILPRFYRTFPPPSWLPAVLLFLIPLPIAVILALQLYGDPMLSRWTAQNVTPSPPPWAYLAGYGLLVPPALIAIVFRKRLVEKSWTFSSLGGRHPDAPWDALSFIITWAGVGALLLYLPVPWQRRLSEGYHFPLCALAAIGLHGVLLPHLRETVRGLARALVIAACAVGSVFLAGASVLGAEVAREPHYISDDDARALAWLQQHATRDDLVLASSIVSNLIPAWSDARVYWGHPFETIDPEVKLATLRQFFRGAMPAQEACAFLQQNRISLVYRGTLEERLGSVRWDALGLSRAYEGGAVIVYRGGPCRG